MGRARAVWGGVAIATLALLLAAIALLVCWSATPQAHVERYLQALADDDLVSAAQLAGLEPDTAMPLGDSGEPSILRIIDRRDQPDGTVAVTAEYGTDRDAVTTTFTLRPGRALLGIVPRWTFSTPPVTVLEVGADQHDRVLVNGSEAVAEAAGRTAQVSAFIPARIDVRIESPLLRADAVAVRLSGEPSDPVLLAVSPTDRLVRSVARELERQLTECTLQTVLQPSGCPFGRAIDDRVIDRPRWQVTELPAVTIGAGVEPGRWRVEAVAEMRLLVTVQSLFDGTVSERDERLPTIIRGTVVVLPAGPELTVLIQR